MEIKEAIAGLRNMQKFNYTLAPDEVFTMAISALDKQDGKEPKEAKNVYPPEQFACPACGCCVGRHKTIRKINDLLGEVLTDCKVEFNFCHDCGQKIDWSEWKEANENG